MAGGFGGSGAAGAARGVGALSSIPPSGSCQTWDIQQGCDILRAAKPVGTMVLQSRSHGSSGKCRIAGRREGGWGWPGQVPEHS